MSSDTALNQKSASKGQLLLGVGILMLGVAMVVGATMIPSDAGYAGVGPDFLPALVGVVLSLCGILVVWEARSGGFRNMEAPNGADTGFWSGFAWMSAGLLANAALITDANNFWLLEDSARAISPPRSLGSASPFAKALR